MAKDLKYINETYPKLKEKARAAIIKLKTSKSFYFEQENPYVKGYLDIVWDNNGDLVFQCPKVPRTKTGGWNISSSNKRK